MPVFGENGEYAGTIGLSPAAESAPLPPKMNAPSDPRLGMVLTPPDAHHLALARQAGVSEYVTRYGPVNTAERFAREHERIAAAGLRLSVVEGYLPMRPVILGEPARDEAIGEIRRLLETMGKHGVEILCANFMLSDWTRTAFDLPTRGGALTNGFRLGEGPEVPREDRRTAAALWENLAYFLERVLPVAESCGVRLAMHPDDPPLPTLGGGDQILYCPEAFERLLNLSESPALGVCFCQGTFSAMGAEIPALIRRFGSRIHYVHFRDLRGTPEAFTETFHDDGQTDMAAAMRAYRQIGFRGILRPDHVPLMAGESGPADGYSMLGRLFAAGYIRGLLDATRDGMAAE